MAERLDIAIGESGASTVRRRLSDIGQTATRTGAAVQPLHNIRVAESGSRTVRRNINDIGRAGSSVTTQIQLLIRTLASLGLAAGALEVVRRSVASFADFERGLIAVGKTTNASGAELDALGKGVRDLSRTIPVATGEMLSIAQAAGQLGVKGNANILRFVETVGKLGLASDLSGEEAATSLARILTVTGDGIEQVDRLGSTIVRLGNNFAATEAEITAVATRVAQSTSLFDVGAKDVLGIATALRAVGVQAELGGSTVGAAFQAINTAVRQGGEELATLERITGQTGKALREEFFEDSVATFQRFVEGLGAVQQSGGDVKAALEGVGLNGREVVQVLGTLAKRSDVLGNALGHANKEWEANLALSQEAAIAATSFSAQMQIVSNAVDEAAAEVGRALAPALLDAAQTFRDFLIAGLESGRFVEVLERIRQVAIAVAIVLASRLVVALAKSAAGFLATQRAAFRLHVLVAGLHGHSRRAAIGLLLLSRAASGLKTAMAFLGGPLGVATLAFFAIFEFARANNQARQSLAGLPQDIDAYRESLRKLNEEQLKVRQLDALAAVGNAQQVLSRAEKRLDNLSRQRFDKGPGRQERRIRLEGTIADAEATLKRAREIFALTNQARAGTLPPPPAPAVDTPAVNTAAADIAVQTAQQTNDEIVQIAAQANDQIAQLTLDRLQLVNRAERQQLDQLRMLGEQQGADAQKIEETKTAVVQVAAIKRAQIQEEARLQNERKRAQEDRAEQERLLEHDRALQQVQQRLVDIGLAERNVAVEAELWAREMRKAIDVNRKGGQQALDAVNAIVAQTRKLASNDPIAGLLIGLQRYAAQAQSVAEQAAQATERALQGIEDRIVRFVRTGKLEFEDLVDSILTDLARITVRELITTPLATALGRLLGRGGNTPQIQATQMPASAQTTATPVMDKLAATLPPATAAMDKLANALPPTPPPMDKLANALTVSSPVMDKLADALPPTPPPMDKLADALPPATAAMNKLANALPPAPPPMDKLADALTVSSPVMDKLADALTTATPAMDRLATTLPAAAQQMQQAATAQAQAAMQMQAAAAQMQVAGGGSDRSGGILAALFGIQHGGLIRGPGTGRSDSIPFRLSTGEYVVNAAATRRHLPVLHAMNAGASVDGGSPTIVQVIDQRTTGTDDESLQVSDRRGPDGRRLVQVLIRDTVAAGLRRGEFDAPLRHRYGAQPAIAPR